MTLKRTECILSLVKIFSGIHDLLNHFDVNPGKFKAIHRRMEKWKEICKNTDELNAFVWQISIFSEINKTIYCIADSIFLYITNWNTLYGTHTIRQSHYIAVTCYLKYNVICTFSLSILIKYYFCRILCSDKIYLTML